MRIRTATLADESQIRQIHLAAFGEEEKEAVATLACELLHEDSTPEILHLVAEEDSEVIGHVVFSPLRSESNGRVIGPILGPLAVAPQNQKQGIGSQLVREGLQRIETQGISIVMVYGDPDYYGRFGFNAPLAERFTPPFELQYPFGWQALAFGNAEPNAPSEAIQCVAPLNKPELW